jgi:hypothetical protein
MDNFLLVDVHALGGCRRFPTGGIYPPGFMLYPPKGHTMTQFNDWVARFGADDGVWLQAMFEHYTQGLRVVENIHVARLSDEEELEILREQADGGLEEWGDWEMISPHSGEHYVMGCNWRN